VTGPEHYREGERLLAESEETSVHFNPDKSRALAAQARAHFLAALVASHAAAEHPESVAWAKVIEP
jgi:hypothetical protein